MRHVSYRTVYCIEYFCEKICLKYHELAQSIINWLNITLHIFCTPT